jgi:probable rRNA maturation factor
MYLRPWRVDLVTRAGVEQLVPGVRLARQVQRALNVSGAPKPASVTVVLTDDDELAELNQEHMGHEGPTDVLSFPMLPPETFRRGSAARRSSASAKRAPRTHIGDIAISVERAIEQAEQGRGGQTSDVRWSAGDELRLLVTHGALHLCGWDHAEPADEAAMRAIERELLGEGTRRGARRGRAPEATSGRETRRRRPADACPCRRSRS